MMTDVAPLPRLLVLLSATLAAFAQLYTAPAGTRPAIRRLGPSILPGGRIVAPHGAEAVTGSEAFGLIVSPSGRIVVTSNGGPEWNSLTVIEHDRGGKWQARQFEARPEDSAVRDGEEWRSAFLGLAFAGDHAVWAAEGSSGRIALFDWNSGRRRSIDLNAPGFRDSHAGDMVLDTPRGKLYVLDRANSRVAVVDTKTRQVTASVPVGRLPTALAYAPGRNKLYVANPGGAESSSVTVVDVANPAEPKVETAIQTGIAPGEKSLRGGVPAGIALSPEHVYVSNAVNDSIGVIDGTTNRLEAEIPIRIAGLADFRGVLPIGLAYHAPSGWLLVAEAGINAVGVIDTRARQVIGHIPVGWFPARVAINGDTVFVTNTRGHGRGPSHGPHALPKDMRRQGTLSIFTIPSREELAGLTALVMEANGFQPRPAPPRPMPAGVKHVVLIVKESRTFDEVLGDLPPAGNGPVMADPSLARFGAEGFADGRGVRLSIKNANIAPNHRAIARRWAFSDNFYADGEIGVAPSVDSNIPDQQRAEQFIGEIDAKYVKAGSDLPPLLVLHLPNDRMADPRPADGYPYAESFVADNDYALGRILEYLSGTKWWKEMAVFVTERTANGGVDHVDSSRTLLMVAGPWARRNYASHVNASFPGLLKTIQRLLGQPPLNLFEAAAADLSDCFTTEPDFTSYKALPVDARIFDPASARPGTPAPR